MKENIIEKNIENSESSQILDVENSAEIISSVQHLIEKKSLNLDSNNNNTNLGPGQAENNAWTLGVPIGAQVKISTPSRAYTSRTQLNFPDNIPPSENKKGKKKKSALRGRPSVVYLEQKKDSLIVPESTPEAFRTNNNNNNNNLPVNPLIGILSTLMNNNSTHSMNTTTPNGTTSTSIINPSVHKKAPSEEDEAELSESEMDLALKIDSMMECPEALRGKEEESEEELEPPKKSKKKKVAKRKEKKVATRKSPRTKK